MNLDFVTSTLHPIDEARAILEALETWGKPEFATALRVSDTKRPPKESGLLSKEGLPIVEIANHFSFVVSWVDGRFRDSVTIADFPTPAGAVYFATQLGVMWGVPVGE